MDGWNASVKERAFEGLSVGGEEAGGRAPGVGDTSSRGQRPGKASITVRQGRFCTEQEAEPRGDPGCRRAPHQTGVSCSSEGKTD